MSFSIADLSQEQKEKLLDAVLHQFGAPLDPAHYARGIVYDRQNHTLTSVQGRYGNPRVYSYICGYVDAMVEGAE